MLPRLSPSLTSTPNPNPNLSLRLRQTQNQNQNQNQSPSRTRLQTRSPNQRLRNRLLKTEVQAMTTLPPLQRMILLMASILLAAILTQPAMSGHRPGSFFRRARYRLTRLLKRIYLRLMNWIIRTTLRLWR